MQASYSTQGALRPVITRREAFGIVGKGAALGVTAAAAVLVLTPEPTAAVAAQPDRLLGMIESYVAARDVWRDTKFATDEAADAAYVASVEPKWDALANDPPAATSEAGVQAALRLAHEDLGLNTEGFGRSLVGAALGFFVGRG